MKQQQIRLSKVIKTLLKDKRGSLPASHIQGLNSDSEMKNLKKGKKDEKRDGGAFTTCFEGHKIYIQ
jgi:predicted CopG family antitoxin